MDSQTEDSRSNSCRHHKVGGTGQHANYSSTLLLQSAMCIVCVLSSVCVAVFDRDELTCIKLLWLYRKFC